MYPNVIKNEKLLDKNLKLKIWILPSIQIKYFERNIQAKIKLILCAINILLAEIIRVADVKLLRIYRLKLIYEKLP